MSDSNDLWTGQIRRIAIGEDDQRDGELFALGQRRDGYRPTWELDFGEDTPAVTSIQGDYLVSNARRVSRAGAWAHEDSIRRFSVLAD